jgi:hypothetical protein
MYEYTAQEIQDVRKYTVHSTPYTAHNGTKRYVFSRTKLNTHRFRRGHREELLHTLHVWGVHSITYLHAYTTRWVHSITYLPNGIEYASFPPWAHTRQGRC